MGRLDKEKQQKLEPKRINFAINELSKLGIQVQAETNTMISFLFEGQIIHYYPYSGWHTGKGIKDGRGWENLKKQLIKK